METWTATQSPFTRKVSIMYNHYRHLVRAAPSATPVVTIRTADQAPSSLTAPAKPSRLREIASNVAPALPFMVAIVMIAGFAIAAYPLIVHDLPVFLAQSPLG